MSIRDVQRVSKMILMWRGGFNDSFFCFGGGKFKAWLLERKGKVELVTVVAQHRILALVFGYDTMF